MAVSLFQMKETYERDLEDLDYFFPSLSHTLHFNLLSKLGLLYISYRLIEFFTDNIRNQDIS